MKYRVLSITINTTAASLSLVAPYSLDAPREEVIDTASNDLFADCKTLRDVEIAYEGFWNYLNSDDVVHSPSEKVKVLLVERLLNS